ncbi:MAG: hypothetical protein U5K30_01480 [Acidimicrobiales bacterium]|nr:hypothetical protein [Acidimicrobiales bacterium]
MADYWRKILCALMAYSLLIAACGGDSDDGRADTLSDPEPPEQSDGDDDRDSTSEAENEDQGVLDESALEKRLLTVADMPSGYTISPPEESDDTEADDLCEEVFEEIGFDEDSAAGPEAEVSFSKGEASIAGGAVVQQSLGSAEADKLEENFDKLGEAFDACREFSTTDEDGTMTGTFSPLSFTKFGDDTFAMHLSGDVSSEGFDFPISGDMVFVREGNVVMTIASFGFGMVNIPVEELEQIVEAAHAKL